MQKQIVTELNGKILILKNIKPYKGLITLQYLPNGGIQMVTDDIIIINTTYGYVSSNLVNFNGEDYTIKEFNLIFPNLVNYILPL